MTGLKPYLCRSAAAHAAGLGGLLLLGPGAAKRAGKAYTIDFVGGTTLSVAGAASSPAPAPAPSSVRPPPQADPDEWSSGRRRAAAPLPRPSLLAGAREEAPAAGKGAPAAAGKGGPEAGGSGAAAGVSTDRDNFPYPWYVAQLRLMLWQAWQRRLPAGGGEGTVVFSIMRNGAVTDLRMEDGSGDRGFDAAALDAVRAAAPFPPLPSGFPEPFLKIHLALTGGR